MPVTCIIVYSQVPDEAVSKCTACGTDFGAFVRRVHLFPMCDEMYLWFTPTFVVNLIPLPFPNSLSITAETVETFSVTSVRMEELLLLPMRTLSQSEFVTDAWYML